MADRPAGNPHATRSVIHAQNGMVATSQPLAATAGIQILQKGGNAFDAAVAVAAVLAVVEPMQTGLGGDMFALLYNQKNKKVEGLNGSGRSPLKATREYYLQAGIKKMPMLGALSITTPGTVDGWAEILEKHGTLSFEEVLQPAIHYAEEGFPISEIIAAQWQDCADVLLATEAGRQQYLWNDQAPKEGQIIRLPALANTLKAIAKYGRDGFYKGEIAEELIRSVQEQGGLLTLEDLASHRSEWVEPISTTYKEYEVYQIPPNGQGITTLTMLNIVKNLPLEGLKHNSSEYIHLLTEAKKIAYAYRDQYIADPKHAAVPTESMLNEELAAYNASQINSTQAKDHYEAPLDIPGDTVYVTVVDKDRNTISLINSLFTGFGSGVIAGKTGVCLQNRGYGFTLEEGHLNTLEPGKRPFHTIIPAFVTKNNQPFYSYGVMGGDMQPQGQVQVLLNLLHFGMNVQEAGEVPRFRHFTHGLAVESGISVQVQQELMRKGHKLIAALDDYGGYQGIIIHPETNSLQGGSDPRKDGMAIGY